jgi:membrane protein implicated in regulation of membrane protease activity
LETQTKLQTKFSATVNEVFKSKTKLNIALSAILMFIGILTVGVIILLLVEFLLYISAMMISNLPSSVSNNATLIGVVVSAILSFSLTVVTGYYVYLTRKILNQSEKQQKLDFTQRRSQQEFELIQKRLELLYYPLQLSMYCNYENDLCGWSEYHLDTYPIDHDLYDEPWDNDKELDQIIDNFRKDFESYYKYSYLVESNELKDKLNDLQNFLYDYEQINMGNYNLRREIYTNPDYRFFKLCSDINKIAAYGIEEYKNRLYELVNSKSTSSVAKIP